MCSFGPFVHYQYECLSSMSPPPFKMTASTLEYTWMWYIFHEFMAVCKYHACIHSMATIQNNKWTVPKLGTWLTVKRQEMHICVKDVFTVTKDFFHALWNITPIRNDISIPHNLVFYTILTNVPPSSCTHTCHIPPNKPWQDLARIWNTSCSSYLICYYLFL